jgi:ubiquinol-cytochrome c reductase cytochrome c subunit
MRGRISSHGSPSRAQVGDDVSQVTVGAPPIPQGPYGRSAIMTGEVKRIVGPAGAIVACAFVLLSSHAVAQEPTLEERGGELYEEKCASCHGPQGSGTEFGPTLRGVGAASADFQLRTGRMPAADPTAATQQKPQTLDDEQIEALVAYVASLGEGPEIPTVNTTGADLSTGAELFAANCAPCHGASAHGGAVGDDAFAPSLYAARPLEIAEAVIVGPGEMPVFAFGEDDRNAIVAYLKYLQEEDAPGGLDIGGIGPVPEGYVAWFVAMVVLVIVVVLIGRSSSREKGA